MLFRSNNINHVKEKSFVHSTFWYENMNGSQYIADKLAEELHICYDTDIKNITLFLILQYILSSTIEKCSSPIGDGNYIIRMKSAKRGEN